MYIITGLIDLEDGESISVYPNPLKGSILNVTGPELRNIEDIKVITTVGDVLFDCSFHFINDEHLELTFHIQPSSGLYYLRLSLANYRYR